MQSQDHAFSRMPLLMLAAGTFAIGTEGFMIAPLLPAIAQGLDKSVVQAGQLVTGFTLTYGLSSPLLTAASARMERKRLLLLSLAVFLAGNLLCAWSDDFTTLLVARLLMGAAAGLFMPNANAVASGLVAAAQRGRALALVAGGQSLAIAIGVPLAALLGAHAGWRATFIAVAAMTVVAMVGVGIGMKAQPAAVASTRWMDRFAPLRQTTVVAALCVTVLWAAGAYTMLTYLAAYLASTLDVEGARVGGFMAVWGGAAAAGVFVGGRANDRFGSARVLRVTLAALGLAFFGLWGVSQWTAAAYPVRMVLVLASLVMWGTAVWGFFPAQQARLIGLAGAASAPLVLSLNASAMYLGFAAGSALGGAVLQGHAPGALGLAAGLCELAALIAVVLGGRLPAPNLARSG